MINEIEKGQLVSTTIQCFQRADGSLKNFPGLLKKIISEKAWERRVHNGRVIELSSLRELIESKPVDGWGQDPAKIEAVIRDDVEALAMWREEMTEEPGGDRQSKEHKSNSDNITNAFTSDDRGTSRSYTVARLKQQAPELFEKVVSGELSANAAAIQAGFRKVKTPLENLEYWWRKASEVERAEFLLKVDGNP